MNTKKYMSNIEGFREVYSKKSSFLWTVFFVVIFYFLISAIQNSGQLYQIGRYNMAFVKKVDLMYLVIINLYLNNLSTAELLVHSALVFLLAINITVAIYYFKKRGKVTGGTSTFISSVLGLFGTGCAACGSVVITSFLGTTGTVGALSKLPFAGNEFMYVAIIFLLYSIYTILKKIKQPFVC